MAGARMSDPISPDYYRAMSPEPIDVIEAWGLPFHLAQVIKYVARAGRKGGPEKFAEDLRKARFYLDRAINADVKERSAPPTSDRTPTVSLSPEAVAAAIKADEFAEEPTPVEVPTASLPARRRSITY